MYKISNIFKHFVITTSLVSLLLFAFVNEANSSILPFDRYYPPSERIRSDVHLEGYDGGFRCSSGVLDNNNFYDLDAQDVNGNFKAIMAEVLAAGYAVSWYTGIFGSVASVAATTYLVVQTTNYRNLADDIYPKLRICGEGWYSYSVYNPVKNEFTDDLSTIASENKSKIPNYYGIKTTGKGSYKKSLNDWYTSEVDLSKFNLLNQKYREYLYGGKEYKSSGTSCTDPRAERANYLDDKGNKISGNEQLYYMRGSGAANSNFACERFLPVNGLDGNQIKLYSEAYECCNAVKNKYMCFEYGDKNWFCDTTKGSCVLPNVSDGHDLKVKLKSSPQNSRLICAETLNLFIFDFKVAGGTEKYERFCDPNRCGSTCEKDECSSEKEVVYKKTSTTSDSTILTPAYNKIKNICSFNRHCIELGVDKKEISTHSTTISPACINFIGDSRNISAAQAGVASEFFGNAITSEAVGFPDILGGYNGFTAPVVQCFKETFDNIFRNVGAITVCGIEGEYPDKNDKCKCGLYVSKEGVPFEELDSFVEEGCVNPIKDIVKPSRPTNYFKRIQETFRGIIIGIITLYIMLAGFRSGMGGILTLAGKDAMKNWQTLMKAVFKLSLVLYFTLGDAWQTTFFEGVYKAADVLSAPLVDMGRPLDSNGDVWSIKLDGCQFDSQSLEEKGLGDYAPGKEYLKIWDTLDCKVARYLGYSTTGDLVSGLLMALAISAFIPTFGIFIFVALLFFGIFILAIAILLAHLFIMSSIAVVVLVYISPIVIPTVLFKRTSNMFKKWLGLLTSFAIQPVIATVYVVVFVGVIDSVLLGSAYYKGPANNRHIVCHPLALQDSIMCLISDSVEYNFIVASGWVNASESDSPDEITQKVNILENNGIDVREIKATLKTDKSIGIQMINNKIYEVRRVSHISVTPFSSSLSLLGINGVGDGLNKAISNSLTAGVSLMFIPTLAPAVVWNMIFTLMKAALILYVFFQVLLKIPGVAAKLTGGMGISAVDIGVWDTGKQVFGWTETTGKVLSSPMRMYRKASKSSGAKPKVGVSRAESPVKVPQKAKEGGSPINAIQGASEEGEATPINTIQGVNEGEESEENATPESPQNLTISPDSESQLSASENFGAGSGSVESFSESNDAGSGSMEELASDLMGSVPPYVEEPSLAGASAQSPVSMDEGLAGSPTGDNGEQREPLSAPPLVESTSPSPLLAGEDPYAGTGVDDSEEQEGPPPVETLESSPAPTNESTTRSSAATDAQRREEPPLVEE